MTETVAGIIEANGGACTSTGGGSGAGGMVAFHYKTAQLGGIISSYGGTGTVPGAAGTVYHYQTGPTVYRKVSNISYLLSVCGAAVHIWTNVILTCLTCMLPECNALWHKDNKLNVFTMNVMLPEVTSLLSVGDYHECYAP